jgi:tellurite resistance protein
MQKQLFTAFLLLLLSACSSEEMVQREGNQVEAATVQSGNIASQKKAIPQQNTQSQKYDEAAAPADKTQHPTAKEGNVTVASKQPPIGSKQPQQFKNATNQNTNSSTNDPQQTNTTLTYDQVKSTLHQGMSKEEAEAFLKVAGVKVVSALDEKTMYRYDIAFPEYYQFTATLTEDGTQLDDVDIEGIKKYKGVIVFVEYDEQAVIKGYSIFYVDEKTQKVHGYYHYPTFEKTYFLE